MCHQRNCILHLLLLATLKHISRQNYHHLTWWISRLITKPLPPLPCSPLILSSTFGPFNHTQSWYHTLFTITMGNINQIKHFTFFHLFTLCLFILALDSTSPVSKLLTFHYPSWAHQATHSNSKHLTIKRLCSK